MIIHAQTSLILAVQTSPLEVTPTRKTALLRMRFLELVLGLKRKPTKQFMGFASTVTFRLAWTKSTPMPGAFYTRNGPSWNLSAHLKCPWGFLSHLFQNLTAPMDMEISSNFQPQFIHSPARLRLFWRQFGRLL